MDFWSNIERQSKRDQRRAEQYPPTRNKWYMDPVERLARARQSKYGLSPEDVARMLDDQCGGCAICAKPIRGLRFHVDHDHATGKVRGLLCHHCNTRLLPSVEHPDPFIDAALAYLQRGGFRKM